MNEPAADRPGPREQIAGLNFALLLLGPDMTVAEANPAAESLLGISARRLLGKSLFEVLDLDQSNIGPRLRDSESPLVARGLDVLRAESSRRINLTISPLPAQPGWRVLTLSDAGQGERLSGDTPHLSLRGPAVLAHEIKNPLAAIRGAAQLLARKVGGAELPWTRLIADEVDRIAQLIDRMQRLGREGAEPVAPLNPHEAIRRALETVRLASDARVEWREEFDPSLPPVLANEGALVQVLVNLMGNARDACAASASPQVVVRSRFVSGLVLNVMRLGIPVKLPIEISISDNGPGVDPALREHIFEPFVSSKPQGQGLGLALVQKLVRDMDGRISHEREEARGDAGGWTHFRVHLPMARQGAGA